MKKNLLILGLLLCSIPAFSQRTCATHDIHEALELSDPNYKNRMQEIEEHTQSYVASQSLSKTAATAYTIPVVFHVLYNTASQNISDAQIMAQLAQLNQDFSKTNPDAAYIPAAFAGLSSSADIQFCLAQRTPSGAATTGIVRKPTSVPLFTYDNAMKYSASGGDDAWDRNSYLNVWICNLGSGLLGFAQFPGGTESSDGVVVLYKAVGSLTSPGLISPYHLGRTLTHEVGHWLNLRHIWGDDSGACTGSDLVGDTPNQGAYSVGCPSYPLTDACNSTAPGLMFMNFMDYTNDACTYMFSAGQCTRMQATLAPGGPRASLASSLGCVAPATCAVPTGITAVPASETSAILSWDAMGTMGYNLNYRVAGSTTWSTQFTLAPNHILVGLLPGTTYQYQVQSICGTASTSMWSSIGSFTTMSPATCAIPTGLVETAVTHNTAQLSWTAVAGATSYTVQIRPATTLTWTSMTTTSPTVTATLLLAENNYIWRVRTNCTPTMYSSWSSSDDFTTLETPCTSTYEPNNSPGAAVSITMSVEIKSQIQTSTDVDWYKFNTVGYNKNVQVSLSDLPANYTLTLYYLSGTTLYQVASSANAGTADEVVEYYSNLPRQYFIKINGVSGANSNTNCYKLLVKNIPRKNTIATFPSKTSVAAEENVFSNLNIYPNPALDYLRLDFDATAPQSARMHIMDISGKIIYTENIQTIEGQNNMEVDVHMLQDGMYILQILQDNKILTKKFVKSK